VTRVVCVRASLPRRQAKRSGTVAWSPIDQERGLIAVGTVANAIDDSFETTADLEIMSVDFAPGSGKEMAVKGKVKSSERFHRLAWSGLSSGSSALPLGILAGGMVDGSIGFWNPAIIAKGLCLFLRHTRACMHVRAHACARQCVFVPACP
jgi:hypothetical protein